MSENNRILVGVDGGEGGRAAIGYAAAEAGRADADLWLVHVMPGEPADAIHPHPWLSENSRRPGMELLRKAADEAATYVGAARVRATLLEGRPVPGLVDAASRARLVVVGDDRRSGLERIVTGSVTDRVAGHAPVPVVVVPSSWPAEESSCRVLVAVKDCESSAGLIAPALRHAADRDAELVVIHAWQLDTVHYDVTLSHLDANAWESAARDALEEGLELARRQVPHASGVDVRIDVRHGQPARAIAAAAGNADLLVIGRRRHSFPLGRLGSTGRALIRESRCPVEVQPPVPDLITTDLVLEHEDRFERSATDTLL